MFDDHFVFCCRMRSDHSTSAVLQRLCPPFIAADSWAGIMRSQSNGANVPVHREFCSNAVRQSDDDTIQRSSSPVKIFLHPNKSE